MKNIFKTNETKCRGTALIALLALSCWAASAAENAAEPVETKIQKAKLSDGKNRFDLRGGFQFNVKAAFGGIGGFAAQNTPGTGVYDDGFVLDDLHGNKLVLGVLSTDNFQYQNLSQVRTAGATTFLDMTISSTAATLQTPETDDGVAPGFELVYSRELGRGEKTAWGLQGAVGYTRSSISDNRGLTGSAFVFTDSFDISTVAGPFPVGAGDIPPPPPPAPDGGTLIPVAPSAAVSGMTTIVPGGAVTAGTRDLETDIIGFRVGPYLEYDLSDSVSLTFSGGGVGAVINSEFQYTESTTIPGMGPALQPGVSATQVTSASVSDSEFKGGAYAELSVRARLTDRLDATLGAQYQYTGRFGQTVDTHTASLNLEQSIGVFGGISFKF
jgi:hypothetical protein